MSAKFPAQRVLYVVSLFPCWSETFIVREIQTLIDDGIDVRILSLKRPSEALVHASAASLLDRVHHPQKMRVALWIGLRMLLSSPVMILRTAATIVADTWRSPGVLLKSLVALARGLEHLPSLRRFDPQFIHSHWATYPSTVAWALGRIVDRPFGFTCHAHDIFVNRQLLSRKIEGAALAVTISRHNVDWLQRNVSPLAQRKLAVIHCGVDLEHISWQLDGRSDNLIVAVGRLDPIKGFDTLIEALSLMHRNGIAFHFWLIGEGPLRASLQALVQARGLHDQVEFVGALPQEAVRAALHEATLFALPCQVADDGNRDGIPVALMEAMAAGCAVVSTTVSGIPELIIDDQHGLLVPERDPVALADALGRLLGDGVLRRRLAGAARQRIEDEFDSRKEARKLHLLLAEASNAP